MVILNTIKKFIPQKIFKIFQPAYHYLLAFASALIYGFPSEKLIVIGVTGTTGKTTSVYLMAKMLTELGLVVGYTSTAMFNDGQKEWLNDKKMTMVGRFFTQRILRDMVKNGCQVAIIETTSEGIRQFRHRFINYDFLVFTGLYSEHIDSHGSFENYKQAKGRLFSHLKKCSTKYADDEKKIRKKISNIKKIELNRVKKTIIVNFDDKHAQYFLNFWAEEKYAYTLKNKQNNRRINLVNYYDIKPSGEGTSFKVNKLRINLKLLGDFNATNAMNAVCLGLSQSFSLEDIKNSLEKISGVPGRLEIINEGQNFTVVVDYAFEPNAVRKLYETIKFISYNKIIHVLGSAGGGRDIWRRPKLGELAAQNADYVIITNEDPYDDDPQEIIDQVAQGAIKAGKQQDKNLFKILDRKEAIRKALSLAREGDVVLITGKGSEQAICVANGKKITWDDRRVVRELLNELNNN